MHSHWETYPCTMGERQAFISFDLGCREQLSSLPYEYLVCFRASLQEADERGLPTGDEFARLNALEDFLTVAITDGHGMQVGRITTAGARYFYFYSSLERPEADALADRVAARFSYEMAVRHEPDPQRAGYWRELYPTEDDWQVISDMRVENALRERGDTLTVPRRIVHWVYLRTEEDRERFMASVRSKFDVLECFPSARDEQEKFGVKLAHLGLPDYRSLNSRTLLLSRAARAANGRYDGWETSVCRESSDQSSGSAS